MNEPKRRGRPPKMSPEAALLAAEMRKGIEITALGSSDINPAQIYAKRVWDGQNRDIPRKERLERVAKALAGQGLSMEGVSL